jgi:vacuole morphology and inheritance protein 14
VSVKNGAELLDRLIKDIVAEKASTYVSSAHNHPRRTSADPEGASPTDSSYDGPGAPAFSLSDFIPLLSERIFTMNPFTRMFLVNWITVLDSIPDLELISHLPAFLKGLIMFLSDPNDDVRTATNKALINFLQEIHKVSEVKKTLKVRKSSRVDDSETASGNSPDGPDGPLSAKAKGKMPESLPEDVEATDDWLPGQDTRIDFPLILDILIMFVGDHGISSQVIFLI